MSGFQSFTLVLAVLVLSLLVLASGINIAWHAGHVKGYSIMQVQAIEHGYALYCPTDYSVQHKGKFAWNGECDE